MSRMVSGHVWNFGQHSVELLATAQVLTAILPPAA